MRRRALYILSVSLITAGIVVAADVVLTLVWKEPLSTVYGSIKQGQAEDSLAELEREFPSPEDLRAVQGANVDQKVEGLADLFAEQVATGQGIGRLRIPSIDVDIVVVQGTDTASLQKGPGHYEYTAFPGQGKTIGIAGHRTTYLAPFHDINEVADGDEIVLEMPYGTFAYEVEKHEIVDPEQTEIVRNVGYERLVLTACHPLYSAAQRWAVFAKLTDVSLFAAGDRIWQDP
ncbi:MAG TPA: class E sortase [Actinomycetota bacterium]|nr:class E sortase [Actinomycetota bacterium]